MTEVKQSARKVKIRVLRDFWPEEGRRTRKGEEIFVTTDEAMDGLESGMFERVK